MWWMRSVFLGSRRAFGVVWMSGFRPKRASARTQFRRSLSPRWGQEMAGTVDDVVDVALPLAELPKGPGAVEELENLFSGGRPG